MNGCGAQVYVCVVCSFALEGSKITWNSLCTPLHYMIISLLLLTLSRRLSLYMMSGLSPPSRGLSHLYLRSSWQWLCRQHIVWWRRSCIWLYSVLVWYAFPVSFIRLSDKFNKCTFILLFPHSFAGFWNYGGHCAWYNLVHYCHQLLAFPRS